ncbi:uncharacterized protein DDB_G0271670-like [Lytechinus pictus]|uniref:uncharacterized protein DDB_G0271670-like n=1 Tax=Lytechinus pictus TaxID=7653 RepID=UPI0030B9D772
MILRPEDEKITGQQRRVSFTGVGSSRTSLCASPDDEKVANCNEHISQSHGNYDNNQSSIPSSGDVNDNVKSEGGHDGTVNGEDDQFGHDHREDDEMLVSRNHFGNEGVGANGRDDKEVEGDDDVENEQEDPKFSANDVDDDESSKTSASRDENGVHGDNSQGCEELLGDQHVPAHGGERESVDDDQRHPTSSHSSEIKGSMSMDSPRSSSHHDKNFDVKPNQSDSARSLQSSTSKRQGETSRKCSDASTSATRSRRSSSSSSSSSGSSSGSSTESSSGSDSDSSSTNSDSESSCSSSCSSSSSSSSSNSDSSSSSSSGSDSASSCTDDTERQNYNTRAGKRYRVSSKKSRRASSSDSGRLSSDSGTCSSDSSRSSPDSGRSSLSFASELEGRNKKKKSREPDGQCAQTSTKSHERMKQYEQSQRIVHQETCSPVCVIS